MPSLPEEIRRHYETEVTEDGRLRSGRGQLELFRTREIVRRFLPEGPLTVLDVGGASGVHAEWLIDDGHRVHLIDPVERHVKQALDRLGSHTSFSAAVGDARALDFAAESFDAVLLLGPLYHLTARTDRVLAWAEARRVARPGGLVVGAAISRFASLFDSLSGLEIFESPSFREIVETDLATGEHRNSTGNTDWFTTAYFHRPDELKDEAVEAGLEVISVLGVEGMAAWFPSLGPYWEGSDGRETIMFSARATEAEPSVVGASPHIIAVSKR